MAYEHGPLRSSAMGQGSAPRPPWHTGLEHRRAMPRGEPTCEVEAEGAAGSAVAVAHLAGQRPHGPPAHAQQPQAVLVVVRHRHLARALLLPQHLAAPAGTPAATSQPHTQPQAHRPIDSSHPTAPWPPPDPKAAPAPTPQPPQTARTRLPALPREWLSTFSTPQTARPPKKALPRAALHSPGGHPSLQQRTPTHHRLHGELVQEPLFVHPLCEVMLGAGHSATSYLFQVTVAST